MKKFILLSALCLPLLFVAQTNKQKPSSTLKGKEVKKEKATVVAGSQQYSVLKAQGKLDQYKVIMDKSQAVALKQPVIMSPAKVTTLTPCDFPPFTGSNPYLPSSVAIDDDEKTIALPFNFCFYGVTYNSLNVYDNGNVQFSTNSTGFTSTGFPSTVVNMIAPFWADGKLNNLVGGLRYGKVLVDIQPGHIVISWDSLPYYQGVVTDVSKLNRFQLVLTDGIDPILPPGKNVGFYYTQMQWTTGTASAGTNGFPTTQPGNPATVGANEGNGVDYFQMGRFGVPGNAYDGPQGNNDGISWLNGKKFFFDLCPAAGSNFEPVSTLLGFCDTVRVCGNDTVFIKNTFLGPEPGQVVSITASAASLGASFTYSTYTNPNGGSDIYIIVDGNTAPSGYHTITISATDNGTPALTNGQQLVVYVDQASVNNLNGSIVVTPTLGSCPGGVVTASVSVSGGAPDSYLWNNGLTSSSTTFTTVVPSDSLIFVTLTSGQCLKTIIGDININPVPVASITGNLAFCNGNASTTVLTATNTLNPASQGPHTYNWTGTGTISASGVDSPSVTAGEYTVTVTNQFGCSSVATTTVVMNETPSFTLNSTNAISGGSVYCVNQDTARISITYGGGAPASCGLSSSGPCTTPSSVQIGTGTSANSTTSYPAIYSNWYKNARHQILYRASELTAAGIQPGKISSIAFNISTINGTTTYPNFTIKMKCTTANDLNSTTFDNTGLVQVFNASSINITTGWNTYNLPTAYEWDGVSNILVDVCSGLTAAFTNNSASPYTATSFTSVRYFRDDDDVACMTSNIASGTSSNRPNIKFGNCQGQQSGSQFNVVVTPSAGVVIPASNDSIKFDLPATAGITCYTVSIINPIGNCSKDTIICVEAVQGTTQATLTADNYSVCPSQTVTLNAVGALASYTIQYTDGAGAQSTTVSPVTFNAPATVGAYTYTLLGIGQCGGPLTAFTNTVNVIQGVTTANLTFSQDSVCPGTAITVSANGAILPTYTITYGTSTGTAAVSGTSVSVTPTLTANGYQTYTLTAEGACGGPVTDFVDSVQVYIGTTQATITATADTLCPGSPITLNFTGVLATFTVAYTDASGAHTATTVPVTYTPMAVSNPTFGYVTYTLTGQGPCNGPVTAFTDSVFIKQGVTQATLSVSNTTLCPGSNLTLSALGSLTSYTIAYEDANGTPQVSVNNPVTFVPTSTTSPVFGIKTYSLIAQGPCSGPITVFTNTMEVIQGVTQGTLSVSSATLCPGSSVTLSALGSLASYTIAYVDANGNLQNSVGSQVTFVPASTTAPVFGVHTYSLIAAGPCSGPVTVFTNTLEVIQGVTNATLVATPSVVCIGSPVTLSSTGSLSSYTITYNNGSLNNSVGSQVTFNSAIGGLNVYTLTAQGFCSAPVNIYTASVLVNTLTTLAIDPMPNVVKCVNGSVGLFANVAPSPSQPYTYNWSPAVGTSTNSLYTTSTPVTTTFVVTVNGACANTATASVVVSNFATNINVVIVDSASLCANTELILNSFTSGGKAPYTYNWTIFPDINSISSSPALTTTAPGSEGIYTIMVTSTDSCGFTDSDMQLINVLPPCNIEIGNIITPNGDLANDFFKIKNIEYHPNSSLTIFDRWGKKVYSSANYANEWKAEGLNDGTYFYILDVPDDKKYNGFVQVLR